MDHSKDRVFKSVSAEKAKSATASAAAGVLNGWLPGIMTGLWRVKCGRQGGRRGAISLAAGGQPGIDGAGHWRCRALVVQGIDSAGHWWCRALEVQGIDGAGHWWCRAL
eukprot:739219-Pelagomonas_calceolata.AAC.1